jgi:hypothetical protein
VGEAAATIRRRMTDGGFVENKMIKHTKVADASDQGGHLATTCEKFWASAWLVIALCVLVWLWKCYVTRVDEYLHHVSRVSWVAPQSAALKPGPLAFRYDSDKKELVYVGAVDAKTKFELLGLLPAEVKVKAPEAEATYWSAIDKLAFISNEGLTGLLVSLLCLGGLSGAIGAHLRSLTAFVGNACFKNKLDLVVWWPYYVLRPFTGFILGIVVVVIVQGGFLAVGNGAPSGTLWWVAVAILAGFGDDEFTQKLRQLTKTLFGTSSPQSEGNDKNSPPPPPPDSTLTPPPASTLTPPPASTSPQASPLTPPSDPTPTPRPGDTTT